MGLAELLGLLGGLALFFVWQALDGSGLEAAAGNRMKQILERLTSNRFWVWGLAQNISGCAIIVRDNCYGCRLR
jgi:Na+/phosphate symporter